VIIPFLLCVLQWSKLFSFFVSGGIYYGLSARYEFPVGIIIDLAYCVYKFGLEYKYCIPVGSGRNIKVAM
jgi:hypothetical protein